MSGPAHTSAPADGHNAPHTGGHDTLLPPTVIQAAAKGGEKVTHAGVHAGLESLEHMAPAARAAAIERIATAINTAVKTLPPEAAIAFEKAAQAGKLGAGALKYVPGVGVVAAVAGGAAEYGIATGLGEHRQDAAVTAVTSTAVGMGTAAAGMTALPAAMVVFAANEVVRTGLRAAGYDLEPGVIEARLAKFPERLKTEMSIGEARAAISDPNCDQYKAMESQYRQTFATLLERYHGRLPVGMPQTPEAYVSSRFAEAVRTLNNAPADIPSGLPRLVASPAHGPQEAAGHTVANAEHPAHVAAPAHAATPTAPAPAAPVVAPPVGPNSLRDPRLAAILDANNFQAPNTACTLTDPQGRTQAGSGVAAQAQRGNGQVVATAR